MGGVRMTGLVSGLDTESMVKELVKANSTKVDDAKKAKQKAEWKKEIWADLNTKLLSFHKGALSAFKSAGSYKAKSAKANDETKVSVKANGNATNGTHSVTVKQLASSAYLTGSNIKTGNNSYTTYINSSASTNFEDMTDGMGGSLNLKGQTISITADSGETISYELGGTGDNGVANIEELNKKLAENENFKGLKASIKDGVISFENTSLKKETVDGNEVESGTVYTVNASALGIDGDIDFKAGEDKKTIIAGSLVTNYEKTFTSTDINGGTKLKDIGVAVGTTFSIKGKDFVVDDSTTLKDLASGLSKLGVSASFDEKQGRFYINASGTGAANDFNITSSDNAALDILGLGTTATKIDAKDAIIEYNGVEYTNDSNTLSVNGLEITAKAVSSGPVNIEVSTDTEGMYKTIKDFVKQYNDLIDEMNKLYNEEKTDYDPLTEEEQAQLSDNQAEKWEEKAKQGLLRRDSTLNSMLSQMRSMLNGGIEVTNADGSTTRYSLASLGIVTSSDYTEKGKLHIMGDEDDPQFADQENILKKKLSENPDIFSKVMAGTTENPGFGTQIYNYFNKAMKFRTGISSAQTFYDNLSMDDEIDDWDDKIDSLTDKLQKLEDKYYKQFSAMETAMAKMQQQQANLSALMGMSS